MATALRTGRIRAANFPLAATSLAAAWNAAVDAQRTRLVHDAAAPAPANTAARNAAADAVHERAGMEGARESRECGRDGRAMKDTCGGGDDYDRGSARCDESVQWQWVAARPSCLALGGGYLTTDHPLLLHCHHTQHQHQHACHGRCHEGAGSHAAVPAPCAASPDAAHRQLPLNLAHFVDPVDSVDWPDVADSCGDEPRDPATLHCCLGWQSPAVLPAAGAAAPAARAALHAPMVAAGQAVQHTPRPTEVAPAGLRTEHPAFDGAACVQQLRDTAPCDMAPCDMAPCDTAARDMAPCGMVAVVQCHVVFDAVFSVPQLLLLPCHPDGRPLLSQDLFAFLPPLPDHPLLPSPPPSTVVRHPHPPAASPTSSLPPRTCDPLGPTIDSWRLLTPVEHPFLGRPCLAVHPCNTASTMALMLHAAAHAAAAGSGGGAAAAACGADNKAATWPTAGAAPAAASTGASHDHSQGLELYMLSWLSLVGRIVGMHIPPSLLDRMASLSSAKIP